MGFKAPNYTQVPNDFLDKWLPELGLAETKVLLVIFRKTFGWHKVRDQISLTQLEKLTGLERRHITKAIRKLTERNLIIKKVEGPKSAQVTYYELSFEEDSNNFTQCPKDTPPSVLKTPTKETVQNKKEEYPPTPPERGEVPSAPPHKEGVVAYGPHVKIKKEDYENFCKEYGQKNIDDLIEEVNDWISSGRGKVYKDYSAALRTWIRKRRWVKTSDQEININETKTQTSQGPVDPKKRLIEENYRWTESKLMEKENRTYLNNLRIMIYENRIEASEIPEGIYYYDSLGYRTCFQSLLEKLKTKDYTQNFGALECSIN